MIYTNFKILYFYTDHNPLISTATNPINLNVLTFLNVKTFNVISYISLKRFNNLSFVDII